VADSIAMGVVKSGSRWLSKDGCLVEPCELRAEGCNSDGTQFKGIFVRYLRYYLDSVCPKRRPEGGGVASSSACASPNANTFEQFLATNAQCVWSNARSKDGRLGVHWMGPPPPQLETETNGAIAQTSGVDALLAALKADEPPLSQRSGVSTF